jgi:hypothetical protein
MTNWKVYWGALFASLFAVSLWRNNRKYRERSRWFRLGKAFMDAALVSLLATFCPPLLIAYCVLWATQFIPGDHVIKTTCSVVAGLSFTLIGGFFLEVLLVLGVFAIDLVTGKFFHHWTTAKQPR